MPDGNREIAALRSYLDRLTAGTKIDPTELAPLLADAWDYFEIDGDDGGIGADKLQANRVEQPEWDGTIVSFLIERHGGTCAGSTRADVQRWEVELDRRTASWLPQSPRQVKPMRAGWDASPVADEIIRMIARKETHPGIRWRGDGTVRLTYIRFLPDDGAPNQTVRDRRKRLIDATVNRARERGWKVTDKVIFDPRVH